MSIVIGTPAVEVAAGRVTYRVAVDGFPGAGDLWFSAPEWAAPLVNARADAALLALLMPAMGAGRAIVVDGPVTDELAWSLRGEAQDVVRRVRPELSRVGLEVRHPTPAAIGATGVATGYSAGVDSYATLARHHFAAGVPESLRVTHLLYNNVGSHGHGEEGAELFRRRLELVRPSALSTGLPLVDVDSNVDEFYLTAGIAFQPSHTLRNAAVAHLLSVGLRHFLYASSMPYERVVVAPRFDVSFADPILLPLLSTTGLTLRSSGSDLDRARKIALISEIPNTYPHLDVCTRSTDGFNCSECPKCQRTMLTLELLGVFDRYRAVFRTPRNPRWREDFIVEALTEDLPNARNAAALYDERVGTPLRLRARARVRRLGRRVGRFAGRAARYARRRLRALGSRR